MKKYYSMEGCVNIYKMNEVLLQNSISNPLLQAGFDMDFEISTWIKASPKPALLIIVNLKDAGYYIGEWYMGDIGYDRGNIRLSINMIWLTYTLSSSVAGRNVFSYRNNTNTNAQTTQKITHNHTKLHTKTHKTKSKSTQKRTKLNQ